MSGKREESDRAVDWNTEDLASVRPASSDLDRRDFLKATGAGAALSILAAGEVGAATSDTDAVNTKTRPTYYTSQRVANARENARRYDWAENQKEGAVQAADDILAENTLDDLWRFVTSQGIPRNWWLYEDGGNRLSEVEYAPVEGELWKLSNGEWTLPTNDFAAYRESGRDDEGEFQRELADDQYLVNEEHPEMGEGWGVDDGLGFVDENGDLGRGEGRKWFPVAFHNHWVRSLYGVLELLPPLRDAYIYTGEQRYARAASVLLDRVADVYPELDVSAIANGFRPENGWLTSHGFTGQGKYVGCIWEATHNHRLTSSYDGVFVGQEDDQELVEFLSGKAEEYPGVGRKDSIGHIRKNIEEGLVKQTLPAVESAKMYGNFGMHQKAAAMSAVVMDDPDGYTKEAVDWIFRAGSLLSHGPTEDDSDYWGEWSNTGGNILPTLVGTVDRDGWDNEASPHYSLSRTPSVQMVADPLNQYEAYEGADLYGNLKFKQMFRAGAPLIMLDNYFPHIGDTTGTGKPGIDWGTNIPLSGFEEYGDPVFAQSAYLLNGFTTAGMQGDVFDESPAQLDDEVQAVVDEHGPLDYDSTNMAGYGAATLRDGENYTTQNFGTTYSFLSLPILEASAPTTAYPGSGTLQFEATEPGQRISFEFEVDEAAEYEIELGTFGAPGYGIYDIYVDGTKVATYDFYTSDVGTVPYTELGSLSLSSGSHTIEFRNVGRNENTDDDEAYKLGIRKLLLLTPEEARKREQAQEHGNAKRAVWNYYGRTGGAGTHTHSGALNIGVMAHALNLAPDLGYPESFTQEKAEYWTKNTVSHNTVVVDEERQNGTWVGTPRRFDHTDRVQLMDVEDADVYAQTDEYRRTTAMINVDEENSYAVDFFRVDGGGDHHFSFHGGIPPESGAPVATDGLSLTPQDGGTYAGPDVPFDDHSYNDEVGSGFNYLTNVARDEDPSGTFSLDWDVEDYWDVRDDDADVHLRLTSFSEFDEVALADGPLPEMGGNPDRPLRYAIGHRTGTDLTSTFTSVVEPYAGERFVESVSEVDVTTEDADAEGRAVKVELSNGRVDYVAHGSDPDVMYEVGDAFKFKGAFAVYSERDGDPEHAYLQDGMLLISKARDGPPLVQQPYGRLTGTVEDFTRDLSMENRLAVALDDRGEELADAVGEWVYVETDNERNGAYEIKGVTVESDERATLHVGEKTTVRGFQDPKRPEEGYEYIVSEGASFAIPLGRTWQSG